MRLFHLATAADWAEARASGRYTTSTRGRTLAEEGFIHASRADQWQGVRRRFYADVEEPLVLLVIDSERLEAPVVDEAVSDEPDAETFPHIYGALDLDAVVQVIELSASAGSTSEPGVEARGASATSLETGVASGSTSGGATSPSFFHLFVQEVSVRMAMAIAVMVLALVGTLLGRAAAGDVGTAVGLVVGIAIGVAAAMAIQRRWQLSRRGARPRPHSPTTT